LVVASAFSLAPGIFEARADDLLKITHQGVQRRAVLHRPANVQGRPAPLIILLHGIGGTGENFRTWATFDPVAEREGFVAVYPDAIDTKWSYGRPLEGPMPAIGNETVDDIGFIRLLIDDLVTKKIADSQRVYVVGMSRGALMTFALACALADRLAAVAAIASGMTDHQREDCRPARPVPIMVIAGTNDSVQTYDGWLFSKGRLLSVPETMEFWRALHGCTGQQGRGLPHREKSDPTRVAQIDWTGCKPDSAVRFYRVLNGGHQLPARIANNNPMSEEKFGRRNRDIETAEEVWTFVKNFAR
jgi:polyhydroxybutyrate depolymerase